MKNTHKYLLSIAFSGVLGLLTAYSVSAQHRGTSGGGGGTAAAVSGGGGGGGGSRPSGGGSNGGGSTYRPAPSNSNGGGYRPAVSGSNDGGGNRPAVNNSRPAPSNSNGGGNRPAYNLQHVAVAPARVNSQGIRPTTYNINQGYRARTGFNPGVGVTSYGGGSRAGVNPTSRSYVGTRGYVGEGGRASVGVSGRGFYGHSYLRSHQNYYYNHGYYGTYYGPRLGFSIGFLPYGYYPFYYGDYEYFYSDGLYYQYNNDQYTVVEPPIGAEVSSLPEKAQPIMINGQQYYELNGVYYLPITKDDGTIAYEIAGKDGELNTTNGGDVEQAAPMIGDIVGELPSDCKTIKLNGERFYVSPDGYYFQDAVDANNHKVYKIVGTPADEPGN